MIEWFTKIRQAVTSDRGSVKTVVPKITRDRFAQKRPDYFVEGYEFSIASARKMLRDHRKNHSSYSNKSIALRSIINDYYDAFMMAYTGGQPIEKVSSVLQELIDAAEYGNPIYRADSENNLLDVRVDTNLTLSVLGYGVLVGVEADVMRRAIHVGTPAEICGLYDRLAAHFESRAIGKKAFKKRYAPLLASIDLPASGGPLTQGKALKAYVNSWYNNHREYDWFDGHKRDEKDFMYSGY